MVDKAISMDRVTFKYKDSDSFAIRNISLEIEKGDFLLLVGFSGSGKSTLLKTINGLIPNFHAGTYGGNIAIFGNSIEETDVAKLADKVGFVFQNPENQLSALTVEKEIAFPLENFGVPRDKIASRIDEIIELLNIDFIRYKSPFSISGGEQQITALAAALALDPEILILDEVTAHLSPTSAKLILEILYKLNTEFNKTIILSEHKLDRCIRYANKIAYIENGTLKLIDNVDAVLRNNTYPRSLLPKIPQLYFKLIEKINQSPKRETITKSILNKSNIPLCTDDLLKLVKGGKGL